jgi:hypothetical protein
MTKQVRILGRWRAHARCARRRRAQRVRMMVEVGTSAAAAAAAPPPSLLSLCLDVVAASLASDSAGRTGWSGGCGSDGLDGAVNEFQGEEEELLSAEQLAEALPWELLYRLASRLPPAALESLHHAAQARYAASRLTNRISTHNSAGSCACSASIYYASTFRNFLLLG